MCGFEIRLYEVYEITLYILDLLIGNSFDLVHLWRLLHICRMSEQLHSMRLAFEVPKNLYKDKGNHIILVGISIPG